MGDLFNDQGEFQPDVAAGLSATELNASLALLALDHERAVDAYNAAERSNRTSEKAALRDASNRVAALRSWTRAQAEAAGTRAPHPAIVTEGN